jgi:hypothetical protein
VDDAASKACTQSGTLALLLSVAVLVLIPRWLERPREVALGKYIAYRINLAAELDTLDANPAWQDYRSSQESADLMSIAQLLDLEVPLSDSSKITPSSPQAPSVAASPKPRKLQPDWRPSPPQIVGVMVTQKLVEMPLIADFLNKLNDPQLLTNSMRQSNYFTFSIVRWGDKRNGMMYRNMLKHVCTVNQLEVPTIAAGKKTPDYFAPLLDKDALLKCLTLRDVHDLATFELPTFGNPLQLEGQIQQQIDIKPGTLTGDLFTASIVAQLLLFFTIVYFGAFTNVALSSADFPASGTLFDAFARSRWTLLAMFLALWMPALAAITMSLVSRQWSLMICSVLVLIAVLSINVALSRRLYFGSLTLVFFEVLSKWHASRVPARTSGNERDPRTP